MQSIIGDIGGTNSRLATVDLHSSKRVRQETYASESFATFQDLFASYLATHECAPDVVCLAIAGPVLGRVCEATNLPWRIDADQLESLFSIPNVSLINDLVAQAYGVLDPAPNGLITLQEGLPQIGNRAVIAAGTGLGQSMLIWDGHKHIASASEGGHCDFAPIGQDQIKLLEFASQRFEHVSCEKIASGGLGIPLLYDFFGAQGLKAQHPITLPASDDLFGSTVTKHARSGCPRAQATLRLFVECYAAEAGNLALKAFATGGIYLAGGIAPAIVDELHSFGFVRTFSSKGRFQKFLQQIPIFVVRDPSNGLRGALYHAQRCLNSTYLS